MAYFFSRVCCNNFRFSFEKKSKMCFYSRYSLTPVFSMTSGAIGCIQCPFINLPLEVYAELLAWVFFPLYFETFVVSHIKVVGLCASRANSTTHSLDGDSP